MFYHIEGIVSELEPNLAVLDCAGMGYGIYCTSGTVASLKPGTKQKLYISEAIGESNFDLYGFCSKSEKRCFEMLISVSGIGPKAALSILSYITSEGLALAIMNNDEKSLTVAPGIGKKIAQRVILELKDKISKEVGDSMPQMPASTLKQGEKNVVNDAVTGLTVLGYSNSEIASVLKGIDVTGMSAEQIIKAVLKHMVK